MGGWKAGIFGDWGISVNTLARLSTAATLMALAAIPARAETALSIDGLYFWSRDYIVAMGDRPIPYGNGPGGGFALTLGPDYLFGRISAYGFTAANEEPQMSQELALPYLGVIRVDTLDLSKRFIWADADIGVGVTLGRFTIQAFGGIRYLNAVHDTAHTIDLSAGLFMASPVLASSVTTLDHLVFTGIGPHAELAVRRQLGDHVAFFNSFGGAVLRGTNTLTQTTTASIGGGQATVTTDVYEEPGLVYAINTQAGIAFTLGDGPRAPDLSIGYRANLWWNTNDGEELVDDYHATDQIAVDQGVFVRLTLPLN